MSKTLLENFVYRIEKQRLVKFPDDDNRQIEISNQTDTQDEAQRILEQIAKINEAFGYTKKQAEQPKLPPILDASQHLFPKPAYHPFHSQKHQFEGSHGETLLLPSIRSLKFERQGLRLLGENNLLTAYNVPPIKSVKPTKKPSQLRSTLDSDSLKYPAQLNTQPPNKYFYRPNQVYVPAPETESEHQQLPTHFIIPVRLYKLNKEEYMQRHAPQEYRVKGYKIVGDIDNFYGKAKNKQKFDKTKTKHKTTPKYHLFFLPREMVLNEGAILNPIHTYNSSDILTQGTTNSREEKLTLRPFKIQTSAATSNNPNGNATNTSATTQIVKKRVIPKPLRNKETNVQSVAVQQNQPGGPLAVSASTIRITPPPIAMNTMNGNGINVNLNGMNSKIKPNPNGNSALAAAPSTVTNLTAPDNNNTSSTSNAIKTAFQNIFRFPFRPQTRPVPAATTMLSDSSPELQNVPLQTPQKTNFFAAAQPFFTQQFLPQPLYSADNPNSPNTNNHQFNSPDYKWDDESSSNSGAEEEDDSPEDKPQEEKHIFAQHHKIQQATQQEALKQGGIIIQRLKVRKGGIAIAGPGGVATAGSGGTAIVGPGGYALTHPRSLTIAGPGAKIIAIPSNVDLKDALQRTNLAAKTFPHEGKIVATGPTVYYAPGTGTGTGEAAEL